VTAATYRIEPLVLPDFIDAPDVGDFLEFSELSDALVMSSWGNLDRATPPGARLRYWKDDAYSHMRFFFVRLDGRMVARSWIRCELQENLGSAFLHVDVLDGHTGRGIGRALLGHAETLAAADNRTILMTFTEHPADFDADGPDVITPLTGTGAVEQLAVLMSRMSTDAPTGGLSYEEETWDVARVRNIEDTWRQAGNISLVTAARHRERGELAAYTVLELAPSKPWLADQDDTLVAVSHRGHRLGMRGHHVTHGTATKTGIC
jgi:GNAT superfamily N-acetyltransferase